MHRDDSSMLGAQSHLVTLSAASHASAACQVGLLPLLPLLLLLLPLGLLGLPLGLLLVARDGHGRHGGWRGAHAATGRVLLGHASWHLLGWCRFWSCMATDAAAQVGSWRGTH
jgi:hypothetical protein